MQKVWKKAKGGEQNRADITHTEKKGIENESQELETGSTGLKNRKGLDNKHYRDSSGKIIFEDPILCSQFLRNYVDIPMLKDV